jgi:outer membrane protein OmpA-like peptidoglycan-associated protein
MDEFEKKRRRRMPWIALSIAIGAGLAATAFAVILGASHSRPQPAKAETAFSAAQPAWVGGLVTLIHGAGFPWVDLGFADRILKVSGEAPDLDAKGRALDAVAAAVAANAEVAALDPLIVDNVAVKGGEAGLGAALAALGAAPDVAACQAAFVDTLAGRFIAFETGSARISSESARLLDALTGVALLCKAHRIEIGGHTDRAGSAVRNQRLSQARADAVKAYFGSKKLDVSEMISIGYGQDKPLDVAETPEAYAKNRRIEFTVSPR